MLIDLSGIPLRILKLPTEGRKLVGSTKTKASSLNISFTYDLSLEYVWGDMASQLPVFLDSPEGLLVKYLKKSVFPKTFEHSPQW
jgi:hypothetical protein